MIEVTEKYFYPLGELIDHWPLGSLLPQDTDILNKVGVSTFNTKYQGDIIEFQATIVTNDHITFDVPGIDFVKLSMSDVDELPEFNIQVLISPDYFDVKIIDLGLYILISNTVLKPMVLQGSEFVSDPSKEEVVLEVSGTLGIDSDLGLYFEDSPSITMDQYCSIGDSGIILNFSNLKLALSRICIPNEVLNMGYDDSFRGVYVGEASVIISGLSNEEGLITFRLTDGIIGNTGFSGSLSGEWDVATDVSDPSKQKIDKAKSGLVGNLFHEDIEFAIRNVSMQFDKNSPVEFSIEGLLDLPFFKQLVEVELSLGEGGNILVGIKGLDDGGILKLTKEGLFSLEIDSFHFKKSGDEIAFTMDGDFSLELFDSFPKVGLTGFGIYYDGSKWKPRLEGGRVEVNKSFAFPDDSSGFRIDINELGLEDIDGISHFMISASIQVVSGFEAKGWVKGLRIPLEGDGSITLDGLGLQIAVPSAFEMSGELMLQEDDSFSGGADLEIIPTGLRIAAQVSIKRSVKCNSVYIYVKLGLPSPGIQLGTLPLYIRTIDGLIGVNMTLDADSIYDVFDLSQRNPRGITHASKWKQACGNFSLGIGMGIATATDRLLYVSALVAMLFPQKQLLIEGKASVLSKPSPTKEPPFHALIALQTDPSYAALVNVAAKLEFLKGVLKVDGVAEALYSKDNWYLAIGKKKPHFDEDKPVKVKVLKILPATGYLYLADGILEIGHGITFKKGWDFWIVSAKFKASIVGTTILNWNPTQVKGLLELDGGIKFRVFRKGFDISLAAQVEAEAPDWLICAKMKFKIKINLLFKKIKKTIKLHIHHEKRKKIRTRDSYESLRLIHPIRNDKIDATPVHDRDEYQISSVPALDQIPEVEPDFNPLLAFQLPTNDKTEWPFEQPVDEPVEHITGRFKFNSHLDEVYIIRNPIHEHNKLKQRIKDTLDSSDETTSYGNILYGHWLPVRDPDGKVGTTHLWFSPGPPLYFRVHSKYKGYNYGLIAECHKTIPVNRVRMQDRLFDVSGRWMKRKVRRTMNFMDYSIRKHRKMKVRGIHNFELKSSQGFEIANPLGKLKTCRVNGSEEKPNRLTISFNEPIRTLKFNYEPKSNNEAVLDDSPFGGITASRTKREFLWFRETEDLTPRIELTKNELTISKTQHQTGFNSLVMDIVGQVDILSITYVPDMDITATDVPDVNVFGPDVPDYTIPIKEQSEWAGSIPGYVYAVIFKSAVDRNNKANAREDFRIYYYQVPKPPQTLTPYLLGTYPSALGNPHYIRSNFIVRFLKNYVTDLFPHYVGEPYWLISATDSTVQSEMHTWQWQNAANHVITRNEQEWLDAVGWCPEGDSSPEGDSVMNIKSRDPVRLRLQFDNPVFGLTEYDSVSDSESISERWSVDLNSNYLKHSSNVGIHLHETYVLTPSMYNINSPFQLWLKPELKTGQVGFILLKREDSDEYLKISFDMESKLMRIQKENVTDDAATFYFEKKLAISNERWTKIRVHPEKVDYEELRIRIFQGRKTIFDETISWEDLPNSGKLGLFATRDYDGLFDVFEILHHVWHYRLPLNSNTNMTLKHHMHPGNPLLEVQAPISKYFDFFDHMNSWDRRISKSENDESPVSTSALNAWNTKKTSIATKRLDLFNAEWNIALTKGGVQFDILVTEASVRAIRNDIKKQQFELDQLFLGIAESLGFDIASIPDDMEFFVSKHNKAILIHSPEPIDWNRISYENISRVGGGRSIEPRIVYSSDMTKSIIIPVGLSSFQTGIYRWNLQFNGVIPDYLNWVRHWLNSDKTSYQFEWTIQ